MGHRILSLHIKSTSNHIKSIFVQNGALSANLGDKSLNYVTARGGEEQNYFPFRGAIVTDMAFKPLTFFPRPSWRIKEPG